jgi:hypothetical protein
LTYVTYNIYLTNYGQKKVQKQTLAKHIVCRVVIPGVRRPFGGRTGQAGGRPCPLRLI